MKTLIALLGNSPGTVTGMYYALYEHNADDLPDQVVIVANQTRESEESLSLIREKFRYSTDCELVSPRVIEEIVPVEDLADQESTASFQGAIARILRKQREIPGNEVWLSIAGGRKSMSSLAAIAAQLIGVDHIVHLYVDWELEQRGNINQLLQHPEWRESCLHPAKEKYKLVEVPVYLQGQGVEQLDNWLQSGFEEFFLEVVRANPSILQVATSDRESVLAYWKVASEQETLPHRCYKTLTVQVLPSMDDSSVFPVIMSGEGFPDMRGSFMPFFKPDELELFTNLACHPKLASEDMQLVHALGSKLFNSLFNGSLVKYYYRLQVKLEDPTYYLRVCFHIDQAARFHNIPLYRVPWELLFEEDENVNVLGPDPFLALRPNISFSRSILLDQPAGIKPEPLPLRIQVAAASPIASKDSSQELVLLPEEYELNAFYAGLQDVALGVLVNGFDNPPRTFEELKRELDIFRPSVVYFTGHGDRGVLFFEDSEGFVDERPAEVVGNLLAGFGVKLVVLNACYSAQGAAPDTFSVAEKLLGAGIPVVVAMQSAIITGKVAYAPAVVFAKEFFHCLMAGFPVDVSVAEARIAMYQNLPSSLQWTLPVCFMHSKDGRIFVWDQD